MADRPGALALIPDAPTGSALASRETAIARWLDQEEDIEILKEARRRLAYYKRLPEEVRAATALDLRAERRLGQLLGPAKVGRPATSQVATFPREAKDEASRARELAAVPVEVFEEVLAEAKPSRAAVVRKAKVAKAAKVLVDANGAPSEQMPLMVALLEGGEWVRSDYLALTHQTLALLLQRETAALARQSGKVARMEHDLEILARRPAGETVKQAWDAEGVRYEVVQADGTEG